MGAQNFFWMQHCPHQDEPSFEVKSSLNKVKVYTKQMNKNGELLRLLQKCLLEPNPAILGWLICGALRDLVPFLPFKKREKHPRMSVNFSKVASLKPATFLKLTLLHGCFSRS